MKIGFTGTRNGMTEPQRLAFSVLVLRLNANALNGITEFHHGDCVGADFEAAHCASMNLPHAKIVCHPLADDSLRGYFPCNHDTREPKTYFARNRDIVNETDLLIAAPWQATRPAAKTGGGTWQTVEHAAKIGKPVRIVWSDGSVSDLPVGATRGA